VPAPAVTHANSPHHCSRDTKKSGEGFPEGVPGEAGGMLRQYLSGDEVNECTLRRGENGGKNLFSNCEKNSKKSKIMLKGFGRGA